MKYYLECLRNYATFSGRARRSEYWYFYLFNFIFALVAMGIDNLLGLTIENLPYGVVYTLYGLITLIPGLAVTVRRLHDVGKSGWFILIGLIPIIGSIWLIVLMFTDGNKGPNMYGEDPKN
ncbi:DUF805 domain-containing protein [Riemerella columbipharyngis]|uniref:Uncharacterized membrane protein YhaH, DUF805 family n=1 Tax=Riemerella columbipharyngis TaxID=1071918 RepID=A0A1G7DGM9_9FLAO|nr:DUF805 domain-containing protein [Riemerella columbipharyngis]SDE50744.1 Uncharacterized membrane protein YhaH, DUF805 family [Riemerella columbipharyngis]